MTIDAVTLRLVFIFIPGIIAFGIVSALGPKKKRTNLVMVVIIFMYGIFSYAFYYVILSSIPTSVLEYLDVSVIPQIFSTTVIDSGSVINFKEIFIASSVAVVLGILSTINLNRSYGIRMARALRISNRFSDADVWSYTFNSASIDAWATIRDNERGLVYDGYVDAFSQTEETRELLLSRVVVYDGETGEEVDRIPVMYKAFPKDAVTVEFRKVEFHDWTADWIPEGRQPEETGNGRNKENRGGH